MAPLVRLSAVMASPDVWLIANPFAGRKGGFTVNGLGPDDACAALSAQGLSCELRLTERAAHATEIAREASAAGAPVVVAAGGDGTIHEVAEALIGTDTVLGVMPLGSLVNLGRALGIPRDLAKAARIISEHRVVKMDVGRATTGTTSRYFLEGAGVGFDAGLFAYGNLLDKGRWRYLKPMWRFVTNYTPRRVVLAVDGQSEVVPRVLMVNVAVTPYIGLSLMPAPDAKIDDHHLDVVVRQGSSWGLLVRHMAAMVLGRPHQGSTRTLRGRRIEIRGVRRQLMVHADGQLLGRTPVRFDLLPGALKVIVGEGVPGIPSAVETMPDARAA